MESERIDEKALGMLRWRCRRGMLENDLLIERFFQRHAEQLTASQAAALTQLMDLSDNELLDQLPQLLVEPRQVRGPCWPAAGLPLHRGQPRHSHGRAP